MKGERGLTANERDRERGRWREQAVIDLAAVAVQTTCRGGE